MKKTAKETPRPLILAIETATMCGSVALMAADHCLAEISIDTATTHSRRLIQQVDQVMNETATDWDGLEAIAVSLGLFALLFYIVTLVKFGSAIAEKTGS